MAALGRSDLQVQAFDIATPGALTGPELAALLPCWLGRAMRFEPQTTAVFGDHLDRVFGSAAADQAIAEHYRAIDALLADAAVVAPEGVAARFGVKLPNLAEQLAAWKRP